MMTTTTRATRATVARRMTTGRNPRRTIARRALVARASRESAKNSSGEIVDDVVLDMEPCLVGWNDTDANGEPVYCCEEPGGGTRCVSASGERVECAIVEDENGELTVDCSNIERPGRE